MLNDSGYESPRRPINREIKLKLKPSNCNALRKFITPTEIVALKTDTLAKAISTNRPKFAVGQYLYWVEVQGHDQEVSVNPFSIFCGDLKPSSYVNWESNKSVNYNDKEFPLESDGRQNTSLFFIKTDNRFKLEGITKLNNKSFKGKDICVTSREGETLKEALQRDGRFKNISRFELRHDADHASPIIAISKASSFHNIVFSVVITGNSLSDESTSGAAAAANCAGKYTDNGVLENQNEEEMFDADSMAYITGSYRFSKPLQRLSREEIQREMQKCARKNASLTLVPTSKRREYAKEVVTVAKSQFANRNNVARPANFSTHAAKIFPSVGQITCGTVTATCFLVDQDVVMTNNHVVDDIEKSQRSSSDRAAHSSIFVNFDFDTPGRMNQSCVVEASPISDERNFRDDGLDYAFLFLKEKPEGKNPVGNRVRTEVPGYGLVSTIGHPEGHAKLDDTCAIIPKAGMDQEISRRVAEKETTCQRKPSECTLVNRWNDQVKCIHLYNPVLNTKENRNAILPYDTSNMFHGSSGSPVINMSGEIVAIHSVGFELRENNRKTSLLEYGFTFKAIIEDLIKKERTDLVRKCFPMYDTEDMET